MQNLANPRIALHKTQTSHAFFVGIHWDSHTIWLQQIVSCCVFFFLSSNAHRLVWIASLPVPQGRFHQTPGSPTIRDPDVSINKKILNKWMRFLFLGMGGTWGYLKNILRYLKLLETTDIFLQISSQSHHREVLDFTIHNSCHESSQFPRGSIETRSTGYSEISQFRKTINPILI